MNLGSAIGELLPYALGVAISPIPIIAAVLMLMSERARQTAPAFALGWIVGVTLLSLLVLLVLAPADLEPGGSGSTASGWIKVVLGAALVAMAVRRWRRRPRAGEAAPLPGWMRAIDRMPALRAFALAAALAAVNPKNLVLTFAGALAIARADLAAGDTAIAVAVFVVVASCSVAGPVLAFLLLRDRVETPLLRLKDWLARENATVIVVVLLVIGVVLIGKGIQIVSA